MKIILSAFRSNLPEHVNMRNHTQLYNMLRVPYGDAISLCMGSYQGKLELSIMIETDQPNLKIIKEMMQRYQQETCLFIWNDKVAEFYQPNRNAGAGIFDVKIKESSAALGDYTLVLKTGEYIYVG